MKFPAVTIGATLLALTSCRSWDEERTNFVNPVNTRFHVELPKAWRANDLAAVLDFYAPELVANPEFLAAKKDLFGRFTAIEGSWYILDDVVQKSRSRRFTARTLLKLRGPAQGEKRLALENWYSIEAELRDDAWKIVSETLQSEDYAYSQRPAFTEEAAARGIAFEYKPKQVFDKTGVLRDYTAGSGLGVGDYNSDGREDVYMVNGSEGVLYRNNGDGTFTDVTKDAHLDEPYAGVGRFAVFADYDNDGHTDLLIGQLNAPNLLYRNRGDDTFEEVGAQAGLVEQDETVAAAFADFNRDGNLDLYLVNGGNLLSNHPDPIYNALNARANVLYLSNGDGTFTDWTAQAGVGHTGWGLAVATADYDLDGDVDIFVGNDVGFSVLYRNRGDATFEDVTLAAGIVYRGSTMSAAWGDINGDGYPDLFAPAMDSNSRWMISQPGFPSPAQWYVNLFIRPLVLGVLTEMLYGNRFYLNHGDGTFEEVSDTFAVRRNGWAWSGNFLDYDQDGDLDIYNINGFLSGEDRQDL